MASDTYSVRLYEEQTEVVDRLREQQGLGKSDAVRQLVTRGIRDLEGTADNSPTNLQVGQLAGWALLSVSIAAFALGATTAAGAVAAAAAVVFIGAAADHYRGDADGD